MSEFLSYEVSDGVATLTIQRPEKRVFILRSLRWRRDINNPTARETQRDDLRHARRLYRNGGGSK